MTCYISGLHRWDGTGFGPDFRAEAPCDMLVVTSSAELGVMAEPMARLIVSRCAGEGFRGQRSFVSVGCAGVYAGVLEFLHGDAQSARILALEAPRAYVQSRLDRAGLGGPGTGFVAQEVACVIELSRKPEGLARPISHCEILARPAHIGGTAMLAATVARRIAALRADMPDLSVVDFQNVSDWARGLAHLVRRTERDAGAGWLASVEVDQRHYMTARPILDLMRWTDRGPLLVGCLGAGGRLGLLVADHPERRGGWPAPERLTRGAANEDAPPLYMDRAFFGRNNFYFQWNLEPNSHATA